MAPAYALLRISVVGVPFLVVSTTVVPSADSDGGSISGATWGLSQDSQPAKPNTNTGTDIHRPAARKRESATSPIEPSPKKKRCPVSVVGTT